MTRPTAVVVGAGVFGAGLAWALAERGWGVTLLEMHVPAHVRSSSGGATRLLRCAHGDDRWYTRSAWESRASWLQLGEEQGRDELLVTSGLAWFARREGGWETASEATLAAEGVPLERLSPRQAADLFPDLGVDDLAFVLWEPQSGVLRAREAVRALVDAALTRGARLRTGRAQPDGDAVVVDGQRLVADRIVWATGPWLAGMAGVPVPLRVTRQDVTHFGVPADWATPPVPSWVDYDGAAYGHGDLDGRGFKCVSDVEGPPFDPDLGERRVTDATLERSRAYLRLRFPAIGRAPLVSGGTCQYTLTPDTHFLLAPLDERQRIWVLGGASGHGFKHAPAFGRYAAGCLEGGRAPDPRFGLGPRRSDVSLRTAGHRGSRS